MTIKIDIVTYSNFLARAADAILIAAVNCIDENQCCCIPTTQLEYKMCNQMMQIDIRPEFIVSKEVSSERQGLVGQNASPRRQLSHETTRQPQQRALPKILGRSVKEFWPKSFILQLDDSCKASLLPTNTQLLRNLGMPPSLHYVTIQFFGLNRYLTGSNSPKCSENPVTVISICKLEVVQYPITLLVNYSLNKRNTILFPYERLQRGQKIDVYKFGKL